MSTKATVRAFSAAFGIALNQSAGMIETLLYSLEEVTGALDREITSGCRRIDSSARQPRQG
ncbi:MAG: hypothetical protein K2W95_16410 [Candidatus Obscuribacterales bacterium]|nr:hypothetical protein [Candidatus Obscuribacterales bacterium]